MILYLDTSALVKLYVDEPDSEAVSRMVATANVTATSIIAYTEARAAFARRFREKAFSRRDYHRLVSALDEEWERYFAVHVSNDLVHLAGDLAEKHALRGFDAIHLASALMLRKELGSPVAFSCADRKLQQASDLEKLTQPYPQPADGPGP